MKYDFKTDPLNSVENRFCSENTNDMGEALIHQSSHIIISEFRKFFFLVVTSILNLKLKGDISEIKNGTFK